MSQAHEWEPPTDQKILAVLEEIRDELKAANELAKAIGPGVGRPDLPGRIRRPE